ncbi:TPA: hypothetical protein ACGCGJ_001195 [Stenotrophomonas maltophilia]|uniref:hypothetical protein n=1 Tax=Stenotrophomonas TaxID=40323 RepID=UPI00124BC76D|nr:MULTISPECIES: hypothetical protein [Stenotrophomonas]MDH0277303.1 hypothetical protein [Stenotrophomonas sp. GD04089]MDH1911559.1 hypothetical protein [Stenotrophomonas sp. GD03794]
MKKRYSVYSVFLLDGDRRLISRHWWRWTATLWACECARHWLAYAFEVVDECAGAAGRVKS